MINIEETQLFKEFTRRAPATVAGPADLLEQFRRMRAEIQDTEKYIVLSFPEYTPHDHIRHLDRLFSIADRLLGPEIYDRLSSAELVLLVFGLYSHDWGMALAESDIQRLFCGAPGPISDALPGEPEAARQYVDAARLNGLSDRTAQREYIRRTHAQRSGARLRAYFEGTSQVFADAVAKIAEGHTLDIRELRSQQRYPVAQSVFGETANLPAIATYVRIVDLVDIGDDRTPYALWKFVSPLDELSKTEWAKHRALSPAAVPDESAVRVIHFSGRTDDPGVFSALADLQAWTDSQFAGSIGLLRTMPSKYHLRLDSKIKWTIEAVGFDPLLVRFECDRAAVLGLLSNELYRHDPLAFIRELLQNSVDAIDSRASLLRRASLAFNGEIRITLRSTDSAIQLDWSDNGIGMDADVLASYFASVGTSWYSSREAQALADVRPVSKFGVGVLSLFAVSDHIQITTLKDQHSSAANLGMVVEIPGREKYFRIRPCPSLPIGTTISLTIPTRDPAISKESICGALNRIARFVKHRILVDLDGRLVTAESTIGVQNQKAISVEAIMGDSAQQLMDSCDLVSIEFGKQAALYEGTYSALIPKHAGTYYQRDDHKQWVIGNEAVNMESIVTDTEQSVFTKGIQVGPVSRTHRRRDGIYIGARHTDWIPPKVLLNIFDPGLLNFDLNRSVAHFPSKDLTNALWTEIAASLWNIMLGKAAVGAAERAALIGKVAYFGAIPDEGLRSLFDPKQVPLLILRAEHGTGWQFVSNFVHGTQFSEAPFELAYAADYWRVQLDQNALSGWEGEDMLFPVEGFREGRPLYLADLLRFGANILAESGWTPSGLQFVKPTIRESVPLACRIWRKDERVPASLEQGRLAMPWNALKRVCGDPPQLLNFPKGSENIAAFGSRYWNANHPKVLAITKALLALVDSRNQRRLAAKKQDLFDHLTSHAFYGYTVPSRISGRTLAIELPNRLLDLTDGEPFACRDRLATVDFYPGTVGKYHNPYHYELGT